MDAIVTLGKCRECYLWIIVKCPYCGKKHTHGGGPLDGDPREYLGDRVPHCADYRDGRARDPVDNYELVEKPCQ
jgi:hypothetical protein